MRRSRAQPLNLSPDRKIAVIIVGTFLRDRERRVFLFLAVDKGLMLDNLSICRTSTDGSICRKPQLALAPVSLKNSLPLLDADQRRRFPNRTTIPHQSR